MTAHAPQLPLPLPLPLPRPAGACRRRWPMPRSAGGRCWARRPRRAPCPRLRLSCGGPPFWSWATRATACAPRSGGCATPCCRCGGHCAARGRGCGRGLASKRMHAAAAPALANSTRAAPRSQIEDGAGRHALVDSLNVSVATGILLHRLLTAQGEPAAAPAAAAVMAAEAEPAEPAAAAMLES